MEMVEKIARALADHYMVDPETCWPSYEAAARVAIEAMSLEISLDVLMAGAKALALYNIEKDGPAKPHDECATPDDWMGRGANIAGRMQSGEGMRRAFKAMIDAALSSSTRGE